MIHTLHLFRPLNEKLISLLQGLENSDWNKKTVAGNWTVKDIAAHLLDGNVKSISGNRDRFESVDSNQLSSYHNVVNYLNELNAGWVNAMKRVSPELLIEWLSQTHEPFITGLETLDLAAPAWFSVAWAGDDVSPNWFHIAREFTEKWHHQQQIRDAIGQEGILIKTFYQPVLSTFMQALPHQYRLVDAPKGTRIQITIDSDAGGTWILERTETSWIVSEDKKECEVYVTVPANLSWKLFTKAVRYESVKELIKIQGNKSLALPVLQMITVMA